ncbi:hypothetical protein KL866_00790 [Alteromonas sp. ALT199]|nr:hypothetical protein [Alteromonas sp. ALT199]MBT3133673.1 hypothetical protein [Alteromonas sp. ALT199]
MTTLKRQACLLAKQDRHVYVMSSDHGNPVGGGTGDIGSDEYSHYKAL